MFVRSDVAHGTLLDIDADEARAVPGVVAVWTAGRPTAPAGVGSPTANPSAASKPVKDSGPNQYMLCRRMRETEQAMANPWPGRQAPRPTHQHHRPPAVGAIGADLAAAQAELAALEERWLSLDEQQTG